MSVRVDTGITLGCTDCCHNYRPIIIVLHNALKLLATTLQWGKSLYSQQQAKKTRALQYTPLKQNQRCQLMLSAPLSPHTHSQKTSLSPHPYVAVLQAWECKHNAFRAHTWDWCCCCSPIMCQCQRKPTNQTAAHHSHPRWPAPVQEIPVISGLLTVWWHPMSHGLRISSEFATCHHPHYINWLFSHNHTSILVPTGWLWPWIWHMTYI